MQDFTKTEENNSGLELVLKRMAGTTDFEVTKASPITISIRRVLHNIKYVIVITQFGEVSGCFLTQ